jgi:1-pyrroline-4-hydroxy-2-carboxylate deaminase
MSSIDWRGVFPAVTTKFHADESLDADGTARHIDFQIRNGIHGVVSCGSLGEASTLTREEKVEVAAIAVAAAAGRVPVLGTVSEGSTREGLRYIDAALRVGVAGFMVMPSVIYVADAREAMLNLRTMADAAQVPLLIYNNPRADAPHHRSAQSLRRPLCALHGRGRPGLRGPEPGLRRPVGRCGLRLPA